MTDTSNTLSIDTSPTRRRVNRTAVAAVVATLPAWSLSFAESSRGIVLTLLTTVAILAVLATLDRSAVEPVRRRAAAVLAYVVLVVAALVAFVFHPSGAGAILTFAIAAPVGVVLAVAGFTTDELRRFVAAPLLATTAIQAVIVAAQSVTEEAVGYTILHPGGVLLITNDWMVRPQGLYDHVYEPAAVAVIAVALGLALLPGPGRMRTWFLVGIGAATTTVALTHSRSAFLGLLAVFIIGVVGAVRADKGLQVGMTVVGVTFLIPALLTASAWQVRIEETLRGDLDDASLGRITLMKQAIEMAGDNPFAGVGPNRYMTVLESDYTVDEEYPYVVHNQSLMVTAELGILAGILFTALVVWAGVQAYRAGNRPLLLYAAPVPLFVFDVLLYNKPVGLLLFAVWCGAVGALYISSRVPGVTVQVPLSTRDLNES
jgi:hypothetical protein